MLVRKCFNGTGVLEFPILSDYELDLRRLLLRRCIFVLMLLVVATAGNVFGDTLVGAVTYAVYGGGYNGATVDDGYVGPYQFTFTGSVPAPGQVNPISNNSTAIGFCLDYVTNVYVGSTTASDVYLLDGAGNIPNPVPPASPIPPGDPGNQPNINNLNAVDAKVLQLVGYYQSINSNSPSLVPSLTDYKAVGLQLALWSVINGPSNGGTFSLSSNPFTGYSSTFSATDASNALNYATNTLLANYTTFTGSPTYSVYAIVPQSNTQIQGVYWAQPPVGSGGVPAVPEPVGLVALASLGLCCLPIGMVSLRNRRRAKIVA